MNSQLSSLDKRCGRAIPKEKSLKYYKNDFMCKLKSYDYKQMIGNRIPILHLLYTYKIKEYLLRDTLSGISVGMSMIPQAMGYATVLGVPVAYGLYSIVFSSLIYSIFTTSIHASCTIAISGVIFARDQLDTLDIPKINSSTLDENGMSPEMEIQLEAIYAMTFIAGIVCFIITFCKLGCLLRFSSEAHMSSIFGAVAAVIIIKQIPPLLGIFPQSFTGPLNLIKYFIEICKEIPNTNTATLIVSIISVIVLYIVKEVINVKFDKKLPAPIPIDVILMVIGTVLSSVLDWEEKYDMATIGKIPSTIPTPIFPLNSNWTDYFGPGIVLGFITYLGAPVMFRHFAAAHNYKVDLEQESYALGTSLILGSCISNVGLGISSSRIFIMESCGGKTQISYVFAAITSLIVMLVLADFASSLPSCVIAAILVVTFSRASVNFKRVLKYWRQDKIYFIVWMFTFIYAIVFTVSDSLLYGFVFSVIVAAMRTLYPRVTTLDQVDYENNSYYVASNKYEKAYPIAKNVKIINIAGALYYASTDGIKEQILETVNDHQQSVPELHTADLNIHIDLVVNTAITKELPNTKNGNVKEQMEKIEHVILDLSSVPYIDISAMRMFIGLKGKLESDYQVSLHLAACTESTRKTLFNAPNVVEKLNDHIYATIDDALLACRQHTPSTNTDSGDTEVIRNGKLKDNDISDYDIVTTL